MRGAARAPAPVLAAPLACALAVLGLVLALHAPTPARGASVLPVAVLFDFTFTVPLLWWWLAVRGRGASSRSLAFVFAASMLAAHVLVGHRTPVTSAWLAIVAGAIELVVLVRIALALRAARRTPGADFPALATAAAASLLGHNAASRAVAGELSFLAYALAGPWRRPVEGAGRFSHQRELGRGSLVAGIVMVIAMEMGAVHAALVRTHPRVAWTITLSSLWAVLWFFGDYQALRLRRSTLADGVLRLRVGLRASADVRVADIVTVRSGRLGDLPRAGDLLCAYPKPAEPNVLLELAEPVAAFGFYGWPHRVARIALAVDERERFLAALERARVNAGA